MAAPAVGPVEPVRYGKYTLFERLGVGGMAEVFLARQEGAGGFAKKVVVKRILPEFAGDPSFVDMFLAEAQVAAHLSHPNVVQIFDMGQEDTTYFIAMEYVHGPNLLHLLKFATMARESPAAAWVRIASGVAEGLHHAHNAKDPDGAPLGIVHRDINPPNVIVSLEGTPKICDFGVAKSSRRESTVGANLKGKYTYMAPEQVRGDEIDARADVFSLGVVLFELTTNRRLFKRDSELQVLNAVLQDPIPRPSQLVNGYAEGLEEIVMWCLDRDREKRCPDARTLHLTLEEWLRREGGGIDQVGISEWIQRIIPPALREGGAGHHGFYELAPSNRGTPSGVLDAASGNLPPLSMPGASVSRSRPRSVSSARPVTFASLATANPARPPSTGELNPPASPGGQPFSVPPSSTGTPIKVALGAVALLGIGAGLWFAWPHPQPVVAPVVVPPPAPPTAPVRDDEAAARTYVEESRRLIGEGKFAAAALLIAKAKQLDPKEPATNVALAEAEVEAELRARLSAGRQALLDGDFERAASLAKLVLDKEPSHAGALTLLREVKSRQAEKQPTTGQRQTEGRGRLLVLAPEAARVYVDDEPVGSGPRLELQVASGNHRVEVRRDGFRADVHDIRVGRGRVTEVTARVEQREEVRVALAAPNRPTPPSPAPTPVAPVAPTAAPTAPVAAPKTEPAAPTPAPTAPVAAVAPTVAPPAPAAPSPAPAPEGALFTEQMTRPVRISGEDPRFSEDAIRNESGGLAIAQCSVSAEGAVSGCRIVKSVKFMDEAVVESLQGWRMKPATLDGKPVALRNFTFQMRLVPPRQ